MLCLSQSETVNPSIWVQWSHINKIHTAYARWGNKVNRKPRNFGSYDSSLNCLPALLSRWGNSWVHLVRVLSAQLDSLTHELVTEWSGLSLEEGQTAGRVTVPLTSNSQRSLLSSNFIHCLWTNYHMKINYSAFHDRKRW